MKFIARLALSALAVMGLSYLMDGISVSAIDKALIVAIVLGLLNTIVRPILVFLTIPITVLTLGLFLLVINAGMVLLADHFIDGFAVTNGGLFGSKFITALVFSILLSIAQGILYRIFGVKKGQKKKD